jgi:hypothetical protein
MTKPGVISSGLLLFDGLPALRRILQPFLIRGPVHFLFRRSKDSQPDVEEQPFPFAVHY